MSVDQPEITRSVSSKSWQDAAMVKLKMPLNPAADHRFEGGDLVAGLRAVPCGPQERRTDGRRGAVLVIMAIGAVPTRWIQLK